MDFNENKFSTGVKTPEHGKYSVNISFVKFSVTLIGRFTVKCSIFLRGAIE